MLATIFHIELLITKKTVSMKVMLIFFCKKGEKNFEICKTLLYDKQIYRANKFIEKVSTGYEHEMNTCIISHYEKLYDVLQFRQRPDRHRAGQP